MIERQFLITDIDQLLDLHIVDVNRTNGCWSNPRKAIRCMENWVALDGDGGFVASVINVDNWDVLSKTPAGKPFPGWDHVGRHEREALAHWNWFYNKWPLQDLALSDSPDFSGTLNGARFYGDYGKVSVSAFMCSIKQCRENDIWITVNGGRHVVLEAQYSPLHVVSKNIEDCMAGNVRFSEWKKSRMVAHGRP